MRAAFAFLTAISVSIVVAPTGPADTRDGNLLALTAPDGTFLGYTHGGDPIPLTDDLLGGPFPKAPACVDVSVADVEPHALLIYARAFDDADQYAAKVGTIRSLAASANAYVYDAGVATGTAADIKVRCSGGVITVLNEVLPTAKAAASSTTVMDDLEAKGYGDGHVKHWVYYDDTAACTCGGIALLWNIDAPGPANPGGGISPLALFAITFGYDSAHIMLHELAHTMGAVQGSAPRSTGAGHCWDGRDTMCYNDGGPNGGLYTTSVCAVEVFDCGKNDYFHANAPSGSYLETHWNLGSRWNRYLDFADTVYGPV